MNYITVLVFAIALLAQFASSSVVDYKVVCKTDYSYVLREFNLIARDFQDRLSEVKKCLDSSAPDKNDCLESTNIPTMYLWFMSSLNEDGVLIYRHPLTVKTVNELHQDVCATLNETAKRYEYAKDIELKEYNVLADSEGIKSTFEALEIGIKVKTDKSVVLEYIRYIVRLMRKHFNKIKKCLDDGNKKVSFRVCFSNIDDNHDLSNDLNLLPLYVEELGCPKVINDTDLKILLNRCLIYNVYDLVQRFKSSKSDVILRAYDWNLRDEAISGLKEEYVLWFWIKLIGGVLGLAVLVWLIALYFRKNKSFVDDEEKVDYENLENENTDE